MNAGVSLLLELKDTKVEELTISYVDDREDKEMLANLFFI